MTRAEKIVAITEHMKTWNPELLLGFAQEAMRDQLQELTNPQITDTWNEVLRVVSDIPDEH